MEKRLTKRQAEQRIFYAEDIEKQSLQVGDKVLFCDYNRTPSIGIITHRVYSGRLAIKEISTGWMYYRYADKLIKITKNVLTSNGVEIS